MEVFRSPSLRRVGSGPGGTPPLRHRRHWRVAACPAPTSLKWVFPPPLMFYPFFPYPLFPSRRNRLSTNPVDSSMSVYFPVTFPPPTALCPGRQSPPPPVSPGEGGGEAFLRKLWSRNVRRALVASIISSINLKPRAIVLTDVETSRFVTRNKTFLAFCTRLM